MDVKNCSRSLWFLCVLVLLMSFNFGCATHQDVENYKLNTNFENLFKSSAFKAAYDESTKMFLQASTNKQREILKLASLEFVQASKARSVNSPIVKGQASPSINPDVNKNVVQLILSKGYPAQKFTVQTKDGFLLSMQRIPFGRNGTASNKNKIRPCVFLQHGLLSDAADWVMNFANDSLGFLLADAGYDVWLGNSRGNTYSRRHVSLHPNDDRFWDWSFDEMAKYDTTAFIDFILDKTGQSSLYYIGHSQGTIIAFAAFSSLPEYQKKVRFYVGLAPIISLNYIDTMLVYLTLLSDPELYAIFGNRDFLPNNCIIKFLASDVCSEKLTSWICYDIASLVLGGDSSNVNLTRLPVYLDHFPAGTSVKNMIHYAQFVRQKKFSMYDYGTPSKNIKHYGQATPPLYNAHNFNLPSLLFTGGKDRLADPRDVKILESTLPNIVAEINIPNWGHADPVIGLDAPRKCYKTILGWLPQY